MKTFIANIVNLNALLSHKLGNTLMPGHSYVLAKLRVTIKEMFGIGRSYSVVFGIVANTSC